MTKTNFGVRRSLICNYTIVLMMILLTLELTSFPPMQRPMYLYTGTTFADWNGGPQGSFMQILKRALIPIQCSFANYAHTNDKC